MPERREYTCLGCPLGCPLELEHEGKTIIQISGSSCKRGIKYARQEFTDPRRLVSTTARVDGGLWPRLPVKVTGPLPKDRVLEVARIIHALCLRAPIKRGEILLRDIVGEKGVHVVATRSMAATAVPPVA